MADLKWKCKSNEDGEWWFAPTKADGGGWVIADTDSGWVLWYDDWEGQQIGQPSDGPDSLKVFAQRLQDVINEQETDHE